MPPTDRIKATLSTTGTSRVVIRSPGFPKVTVQRGPKSVAITSPVRATGLFDPDAQPEMLVPFEGIGVEAAWELRMPKAANRVAYSTIADVLLTIDYTALDTPDYRTKLTATLDRTVSAERVFSFRHMLQDQWFDLNNPDQTLTPMKVGFTVTSADYPPNLIDDISIAAVSLFRALTATSITFPPPSHWWPHTSVSSSARGTACPLRSCKWLSRSYSSCVSATVRPSSASSRRPGSSRGRAAIASSAATSRASQPSTDDGPKSSAMT